MTPTKGLHAGKCCGAGKTLNLDYDGDYVNLHR